MIDWFQSIHQFCTIDWSSVADIRARDPHIDYSECLGWQYLLRLWTQ